MPTRDIKTRKPGPAIIYIAITDSRFVDAHNDIQPLAKIFHCIQRTHLPKQRTDWRFSLSHPL